MEPTIGPVPLSRVISELVARRGWAEEQADRVLKEAWKAVVEPRVYEQTRVGSVKNGVLTIFVSHSPLLSELVSFHKPALLVAMKTQLPNVKLKDLKFRLDGTITLKRDIA